MAEDNDKLDITPSLTSPVSCQCPQLPLEVLFSSPICWKRVRAKTSDFFHAACNFIKETRKLDPAIQQFTVQLEAISSEWDLYHPHTNWKDKLGQVHYDLVRSFHSTKDKTNKVTGEVTTEVNSRILGMAADAVELVVELLAQIRNKFEHNKLYTDEEKEMLNWHRQFQVNINGNVAWVCEVDKRLYAHYWNKQFPQLELLLWWQYRLFREGLTFKEFYPYWKNESLPQNFRLDFHFSEQLQGALIDHLEHGWVEARYSIGKSTRPHILEYRTLPSDLLHLMLDGSCILEIQVSESGVICEWYDYANGAKTSIDKRVTENVINVGTLFRGTIIVANRISNLDKNFIVNVLGNLDKDNGRIICFTNRDYLGDLKEREAISEMVAKLEICTGLEFVPNPLKWEDIRAITRQRVEGEVKVKLNGTVFKLKELLPETDELRAAILNSLEGERLNELLRESVPEILVKPELPELKLENYVDRQVSRRIEVSSDIFNEADTFVVQNIRSEILQRIISGYNSNGTNDIQIKQVANTNDLMDYSYKIFLLQKEVQDISKIFSVLQTGRPRNIHFLRYAGGNKFQWLGSHGSTCILKNKYVNFTGESETMQESELMNLESHSSSEIENVVLIADLPGMGKSWMLSHLAETIAENYSDRTILSICMDEFTKETVMYGQVNKRTIIKVIIKLLRLDAFAENLAATWLEGKKVPVKLELFLDGLDEVCFDVRDAAINILKVIKEELSCVRAWVTSRDDLLDVIKTRFTPLIFKCSHFSEKEQIQYLTSYWKDYTKRKKGDVDHIPIERLEKFARKCISAFSFDELGTEFSGVPLHCRMIAEIYEANVLKEYLDCNHNERYSIVELYDKMVQKKLQNCLKEKRGMEMNDPFVQPILEKIERFHTYFAVESVFSKGIASNLVKSLGITSECVEEDSFVSAVIQVDILKKVKPVAYFHPSVADYFVARFVQNELTKYIDRNNNQNGNWELNLEKSSPEFQEFLWNHVFAVESIQYRNGRVSHKLKYSTVFKFFDAKWEETARKLVSSQLKKSVDQIAAQIENERTVTTRQQPVKAPLLSAAYNMNSLSIYSLLISSTVHLIPALISGVVNGDFDQAKDMLQNSRQLRPETWNQVQNYNENRYGILHWAVEGIRKLVSAVTTAPVEIIEKSTDFVKFVVERGSRAGYSVMEERDAQGRTPLLLLSNGNNTEGDVDEEAVRKLQKEIILGLVKLFVGELGADVNARDNMGNGMVQLTRNLAKSQMAVVSNMANFTGNVMAGAMAAAFGMPMAMMGLGQLGGNIPSLGGAHHSAGCRYASWSESEDETDDDDNDR